MTEHEIFLHEIKRELRELQVKAALIEQRIMAKLPDNKPAKEKDAGFFLDPEGSRQWYDKKKEAAWEIKNRRGLLTLINKEA